MAVHIKDAVSINVFQLCNVLVYRLVKKSKYTVKILVEVASEEQSHKV